MSYKWGTLPLQLADRLGEELLQQAEHSHDRSSWNEGAGSTGYNLLGFSHGTAGYAYALLRLYRDTGKPKYAQLAERAFNYERSWFDASARNWPDLRGQRRRLKVSRRFLTFWCHGAPGIALSRLYAYQLFGTARLKEEARIGLDATLTAVKAEISSRHAGFSLCHGLSGNGEVLSIGHRVLGPAFSAFARGASDIALTGIERHGTGGRPWPCGVGGGITPSLMVGLAGIGHFYLRMYEPEIPPILLP